MKTMFETISIVAVLALVAVPAAALVFSSLMTMAQTCQDPDDDDEEEDSPDFD